MYPLLPISVTCPVHLISLHLMSNYMSRILVVQVMKFVIVQLLRTCYYFIRLLSAVSSQTSLVYVPPLPSQTKFYTHTELKKKYIFLYFNFQFLKFSINSLEICYFSFGAE
jgi:hypothetical protein